MSMLTIRNIDESLKKKLRITAAELGVSMEEQVRIILRNALYPKTQEKGMGSRIHQHFNNNTSGVNLDLPKRSPPRKPPNLSTE